MRRMHSRPLTGSNTNIKYLLIIFMLNEHFVVRPTVSVAE